jgi:hypothetical protein
LEKLIEISKACQVVSVYYFLNSLLCILAKKTSIAKFEVAEIKRPFYIKRVSFGEPEGFDL